MPLNTTNLISTPNITGNIGQCVSNPTVINGSGRPNAFIQEDTGWITNSCTGETTVIHSWQFTELSEILFTVGIVFFCIISLCLIYKYFVKED